eukprot:jgi/Ulvmu1/3534/UM163_0016.1
MLLLCACAHGPRIRPNIAAAGPSSFRRTSGTSKNVCKIKHRREYKCYAATAVQDDPFSGDPEMQKALDESFDMIQEILEHVCNNMVAENAVAFVTVSPADQTAAKLMSQAVEERLSKFNQMTLHTIHSLLASPTVKQTPQTQVLLEMMKAEILKQAGNALPVELQTLDRLIVEKDDDARTQIINELPAELLEGLALAAGQVISDMEDTAAIADVPLLCGTAIVRDDVLARLEDLRAGAAASARTGRRAVPERIASVIKELVLVADPVTRRAQLFELLQEGCKAPEPPKAAAGTGGGHAGSGGGPEGGLADAVRPGSLLYSIDIIRHEMESNPPAPQGGPASPTAVLRRLSEVKADAVHVVRSVRDGKLAHLSPDKP